ncbi:integrase [Sporosarcina aquimarina]|uniref:integrase n=1 Tax=Sporosarcina aquimarina TaxID=114975 RepID=UPI001C8E5633|nr:integrase [Sporosarcina aquimarina]MBY0223018.1 integrase [Sporosarcina aquimarina]
MNNQLVSDQLYQLVFAVMKKVQMDVPIREVHDGVNMSYNFIGKYIGYDTKRLATAHQEMAPFCTIETYVQTITLHELGHVMDQEALEASLTKTLEFFTMRKSFTMNQIFKDLDLLGMLIEEDLMNKVFEETAWENAARLNEQYGLIETECFEQIRKNSLATYEMVYEEDLYYYEELKRQANIELAC